MKVSRVTGPDLEAPLTRRMRNAAATTSSLLLVIISACGTTASSPATSAEGSADAPQASVEEIPEEEFRRVGIHSERGDISLLQILQMYADHAEAHAKQIRRVRDAFKASKSNKV